MRSRSSSSIPEPSSAMRSSPCSHPPARRRCAPATSRRCTRSRRSAARCARRARRRRRRAPASSAASTSMRHPCWRAFSRDALTTVARTSESSQLPRWPFACVRASDTSASTVLVICVALRPDRLERLDVVVGRALAREHHLAARQDPRERRTQLVRELRREEALVAQAGREAVEQAVERRRELCQLVVRRSEREPPVRLLGAPRGRLLRHHGDRTQCVRQQRARARAAR